MSSLISVVHHHSDATNDKAHNSPKW